MKFSQWTRLSQEHILTPSFVTGGDNTPLTNTAAWVYTPSTAARVQAPAGEKLYQLAFTQMSMCSKCHRHLLTFKKTRRCAMHYGNYARKGKKVNILALTEATFNYMEDCYMETVHNSILLNNEMFHSFDMT